MSPGARIGISTAIVTRPRYRRPNGATALHSGEVSQRTPEELPSGPSVRRLWHRLEHLHAVTYFAPECREAHARAGLKGFWMGYFASRAAPLGPVGPGIVEALFFNFAPAMVRRAIPDAWDYVRPGDLVIDRAEAAAVAL